MNPNGKTTHFWSKLPPTNMDRSGSKCCLISKNKVFVTGGYGQGRFSSEILHIESTTSPPTSSHHFFSIFNWYRNKNLEENLQNKGYWESCTTKPPVNVRFHTMTYLEEGKVMLIGGMNMNKGNDVHSKNVFEGKITNDKEDVTWKELNPLTKCRYGHIAFKMRNSVIAAGGSKGFEKHKSSEKYDLRTGVWKEMFDVLPVGLSNASVVVDLKERFAIITGGETENYKTSNKIIIYTEKHGF